MIRTALILLVLTLGLTFDGNSQESINKYDKNGRRTGVWKKYYSNGHIQYEGQFKEGKEIGVFKHYDASGAKHPVVIKDFEGNRVKVSFYSIEGKLESSGIMINKKREGLWKYFHSDGKTVLSKEHYKLGLQDGESKSYYKSGVMAEHKQYVNGQLHGFSKRYADNGQLLDDLNYKYGILNGPANYYDLKGELILKGSYENDKKVGKWEYYENGKPVNPKKMKQ